MVLEIGSLIGGLVPAIGKAIGGSSQPSMPVYDPQELADSYLESVKSTFGDEIDFAKKETKKSKKKSNQYLEPSRADQRRLEKDILRNFDTYSDSLYDLALKGDISPEEMISEMQDQIDSGLFNPGSIINEKGDTAYSKLLAAKKKMYEEIMPRQRRGSVNAMANTLMGKTLSPEEEAYYNDTALFKNPEDVAAAMMLTEEGDTRFYKSPEEDRFARKWGGRIVNPTAKNIDNMPYYMRQGLSNPAEVSIVSQTRTA